jgi:hypothetical protein
MYGLAMELIASIDVVVLADGGREVTANANNQSTDLFWTLRGAGSSSLGVVSRFTTAKIFHMRQNAVQVLQLGVYLMHYILDVF